MMRGNESRSPLSISAYDMPVHHRRPVYGLSTRMCVQRRSLPARPSTLPTTATVSTSPPRSSLYATSFVSPSSDDNDVYLDIVQQPHNVMSLRKRFTVNDVERSSVSVRSDSLSWDGINTSANTTIVTTVPAMALDETALSEQKELERSRQELDMEGLSLRMLSERSAASLRDFVLEQIRIRNTMRKEQDCVQASHASSRAQAIASAMMLSKKRNVEGLRSLEEADAAAICEADKIKQRSELRRKEMEATLERITAVEKAEKEEARKKMQADHDKLLKLTTLHQEAESILNEVITNIQTTLSDRKAGLDVASLEKQQASATNLLREGSVLMNNSAEWGDKAMEMMLQLKKYAEDATVAAKALLNPVVNTEVAEKAKLPIVSNETASSTTVKSSLDKGAPNGRVSAMDDVIKGRRALLSSNQEKLAQFIADPNTKKMRFAIKIKIQTLVSQIAMSREKIAKQTQLLSEHLQQYAGQDPLVFLYVFDLTASKLVLQGESQVHVKPEFAFAVGTVIVELIKRHGPDFKELVFAYFHRHCPYTIPLFPSRRPNDSDSDFLLRCRFKLNDDGTSAETELKWIERMNGFTTLYAVVLTLGDDGRMEVAWRWFAHVFNMTPRVVVPTLVTTMFQYTGGRMIRTFGKQFLKLMSLAISDDYLSRMPTEASQAAIGRLKIFVEECFQNGTIPRPLGADMPP